MLFSLKMLLGGQYANGWAIVSAGMSFIHAVPHLRGHLDTNIFNYYTAILTQIKIGLGAALCGPIQNSKLEPQHQTYVIT